MLKLLGMAALGIGAVFGISGGPEGDTYSVLGFLISAIGVAAFVVRQAPDIRASADGAASDLAAKSGSGRCALSSSKPTQGEVSDVPCQQPNHVSSAGLERT
jgi:hypothetical protein